MRHVTRRQFVHTGLAAASALAIPSVHTRAKGQARYRTALVGTGWWGTNIVREAIRSESCQIVALCDVDSRQRDAAASEIRSLCADEPRPYADYREMLEREKPEIVIVATPDHWHPLIAIAAVQAGAHVYVEKPICHTIAEGNAMVAAARAADRVMQVGTHRRVSPHNVEGMKFLKEGNAGKIGMIRTFVNYGGGPEEPSPNAEVPDGLDWDAWCGPAPLRAFNPKIHPKGFRNFLDYANGTLGDWGIHWLDQVMWWAGDDVSPRTVYSTGGRDITGQAINDGKVQTTDAPDHQVVAYDFDDFTVTWEHRRFGGNNAEKSDAVGCYFFGTKGTFHMGWRDGWTFYPNNSKQAPLHMDAQLNDPDSQNIRELFADFLGAIREGRKPVSDIAIGNHSTTLSLLGMLSLKLGRSVAWDAQAQEIPGDAEANALLRRAYRDGYTYPV